MTNRRHILCLSLFVLGAAPRPAAAQPSLIGDWSFVGGNGLNGMRFGRDKTSRLDARGEPGGREVDYRWDGRVGVLQGMVDGKLHSIEFALQPDGRLSLTLPNRKQAFLVRRGAAAPSASPAPTGTATPGTATPGTAAPAGPVARVTGLYQQENEPGAALLFAPGAVTFMRQGKAGAQLPFMQQGDQVVIVGPHLDEKLTVLPDGRLRLARDGMRPVFFRKAQP